MEKGKKENEKQGRYGHFTFSMYFKQTREAVLPNIFQNGSNSTREAAPPEEPELEPFLEEPEPCQTRPTYV
jgi:hypothetical protein